MDRSVPPPTGQARSDSPRGDAGNSRSGRRRTGGDDRGRDLIASRHSPDGCNIGINVGEAGGQTVLHLHVHLIPRYHGDVPDPTGGVRHVIPDKGNYRTGN